MLGTRHFEREVHLFQNLPTPLAVNRMAQVFTQPVGYFAAIPEAPLWRFLLQRLVQQGLRRIIENDLTIPLIMLPLVA